MGVNLREVIPEAARREVELRSLKGYVIAMDAYNMLYQFLAAIRQPDGTPLMDRSGRVTSHLSGLFYRTINLVEEGIKPVYVFDGKPPELKRRELEERARRKEEAEEKYREYSEAGLVEEARKYRVQAVRLTNTMVDEAKRLLEAMGIPWVQAPAEGEAQAAYLTIRGDAWATGSQDYDSLLFGAKRLVRNLAITGRRKLPGRAQYVEIRPEIIVLDDLLSSLGIDRKRLIILGLLLGTDFNPGGVKGIGPKTALRYVKASSDHVKLLKTLGGEEELVKAYEFFLNPPVTDDYRIEF
ncbi:MAG: flap endonuclease-1, partial [Desulfurococcales archaeon]|nr:flap endonuclease-1 [Desulfurococcales archaeon]